MKKLLLLVLSLLLCLGMTANVTAEESTFTMSVTIDAEELGLPSSDELFAYYVEQKLYGYEWTTFSQAVNQLTARQEELYKHLESAIKNIAAGNTASAVVVVDSVALESCGYTAAGTINSQAEYDAAAYAFEAEVEADFEAVFKALLLDHPYEMYWFGKTASYQTGYNIKNNNELDFSLTLFFAVARNFQPATGYDEENPTVDTDKTSAATSATTKAQAIVNKYADKTDYEKIIGYIDEICALTSYNHTAAGSGSSAIDNSPWQLLWVFDGETDTNVVCEGYAKAFQYLCDLTNFASSKVESRLVTGNMCGGTGAGPHMWNVVTMDDGMNYIVDVTNSDEGSVGSQGQFKLGGTEDYRPDYDPTPNDNGADNWGDTYAFYCNSLQTMYFTYDAEMSSVYNADALVLASQNYTNVPYVADVDGTKYTDITTALNAWKNFAGTTTLTLLDDIELSEGIKLDTYYGDKVLDLNGHQLSSAKGVVLLIGAGNVLTVQDNAGNGKIVGTTDGVSPVQNDGKLTITGGTFEAGNSIAIANYGTLHISGNTVVRNTSDKRVGVLYPTSISGNVQIYANIDIGFKNEPNLKNATNCLGWVVVNYADYLAMLYPDDWLPSGYALQIDGEIDYELEQNAYGTIATHSTCDFSKWGIDEEEGAHWQGCACGRTQNYASHSYNAKYTNSGDNDHTAACVCGETKTEKHIFGTNGACICGMQAVASVAIGSTTTYYPTMDEALDAAIGQTATVTMLKDGTIERCCHLQSPSNVTLNLNGMVLSANATAFKISKDATLTIAGDEESRFDGINFSELMQLEGTLNITGGNFWLPMDSRSRFIYCSKGSNLNISGGSFELQFSSQSCFVYAYKANITITDTPKFNVTQDNGYGEFVLSGISTLDLQGTNPAGWRVYALDAQPSLILPSTGYALQITDENADEILISSLPVGISCTIVEHTHNYTSVDYDENDHWMICASCGDKKDVAEHSLIHTPNTDDTETHTSACACGYKKASAGTHTFGADNKCTDCEAPAVALVDGTKYAHFANAVAAWEVDTAEAMTLLQNVEYKEGITLEHDCDEYSGFGNCNHAPAKKVLDLNDKTLTITTTGASALTHRVPLTIKDSGTNGAIEYSGVNIYVIYSLNGNLTLNGGTFSTQRDYVLALNGIPTTIDSSKVTLQSSSAAIYIINNIINNEDLTITITGTGCDGWKIDNNTPVESSIKLPDKFHLEYHRGSTPTTNDKIPASSVVVIKADHVHNWTYAADDAADTITATCDATGCTTPKVVVTLPAAEFAYDGSEKSVVPACDVANSGLEAEVTYTGERTNVSEAGFTATMTLGGKTVSKVYTIAPKSVEGATVGDFAKMTYNAKAQQPEVTVAVDDVTLNKDTDYTVTYKDNVNAGTATVTITGKGNYTGETSKTFTISPKPLTDGNINVIADYFYTGEEQKPTVTVMGVEDVILAEGTDYDVSYENNINVGFATVTVTGKGNYTDTATTQFEIIQSGAAITATAEKTSYIYGDTVTITGTVKATGKISETTQPLSLRATPNVELYNGNELLATGVLTDGVYTLNYDTTGKGIVPSTNAITLTVKYLGSNDMAPQSTTVSINLAPKALTATGATATDRAYDGTTEVAIVGVTLTGIETVNGVADNVSVDVTGLMGIISSANAGEYDSITLPEMSLIGEHAGLYTVAGTTVNSTVTISAKKITNPTIVLDPATFVYDGKAKEPAVTVKDGETVIPATEYSVSYQNNTDVGTEAAKPTVVITDNADGNYDVSGTANFAITQSSSAVTAHSYLGETEQTTFTYGDTITIKGSVAADLTAAQTYALRAPVNTANLYYGDTKLAECTMTDNTFVLTYDTTGKALPIGESTLTVEFGGNSNLEGASAEAEITLNKATPEVSAPTDLTATYGQTLADVRLPEGWAWNDDLTTSVGAVGEANHKATFTHTDAAFWNTVEVDVTVTVKKLILTGVEVPENVTLDSYSATKEEAIAKLPATVTYSDYDGNNYTLPATWSCDNYDAQADGENSFTWSVDVPQTNFNFADNVVVTGRITVKNSSAFAVKHTGKDANITYDGSTYDVSQLFEIDTNAGAATYTIIAGEGTGTLSDSELTITKAGTITIKLSTAANIVNGLPYAAGETTATLTVKKGELNVSAPTGLMAEYGQTLADVTLPNAENGVWSWSDDTVKVGESGTQIHKAIFTPTQSDLWNAKEVDVTITVTKSNVALDAVAKTFLDTTEQTTFTYGDVITVKVVPVLPVLMSMDEAFVAPTMDQMAIFYNGRQISAAADAVDGVYTMTYKTTDKMLPVGESKLTVRYVGNDNINSASVDLPVSIVPAELSVSFVTAASRAYEPDNVTVSIDDATLSGVIAPDDVAADVDSLQATIDKADAGEYTEVQLPEEIPLKGAHAAYYKAKGGARVNAAVKITKATLTPEGTPDLDDTASDMTLDDATEAIEQLFAPVKGTVEWTDPAETPVEPGKSYEWTFTPEDSNNYEPVSGSTVLIPLVTYQVTVVNGTGSGEYAEGESVTVTADSVSAGRKFVGWTGLDNLIITSGSAASEQLTFTMPAADVNLTAVFETEQYRVTFIANGGEGSMASQIFINGEAQNLKANIFTREGYTFTGWNTAADGSGKTIGNGAFVQLNSDTILYAQWVIVQPEVPPTGDNVPLGLLCAMLIISGAGCWMLMKKRQRYNH